MDGKITTCGYWLRILPLKIWRKSSSLCSFDNNPLQGELKPGYLLAAPFFLLSFTFSPSLPLGFTAYLRLTLSLLFSPRAGI